MIPLLLGLLLFIGVHLVSTAPELRGGLARRFGEAGFKIVYSLIALAGFALIVAGYHKIQQHTGKSPQLWKPPSWGRHVAMLLMLPVFPLLIATYLKGRLAGIVRHPMITAVKFWALAHLFVRGDAASLLLFGGLLAWAVYDRITLKDREARGLVTVGSGPILNDVIAIVAGLALYYAMIRWGHAALIGVSLVT